jgi:CO/xanthine dehydrogenase FAD-binding subunit
MLVDVGDLAELREIAADDGVTRIGGAVTVGQLERRRR